MSEDLGEDGAGLGAAGLVPEDGLDAEEVEVVRERFLDEAGFAWMGWGLEDVEVDGGLDWVGVGAVIGGEVWACFCDFRGGLFDDGCFWARLGGGFGGPELELALRPGGHHCRPSCMCTRVGGSVLLN